MTGKLDTTSESLPLQLAVISISRNKIFIRLDKTKTNNEEVIEIYSGSGYTLNLTYKKKEEPGHGSIYNGRLIIEHDNLKSEYKVVGTHGYD